MHGWEMISDRILLQICGAILQNGSALTVLGVGADISKLVATCVPREAGCSGLSCGLEGFKSSSSWR